VPARIYLQLWVLREGYPNGVAEAVHEQGADADGGLHAPILTLPGFRHPAGNTSVSLGGALGHIESRTLFLSDPTNLRQ